MHGIENLYIGPSGWSHEDWKGVFYPEKRSRGFHELSWLAQWYNLVEINSSWYHPQSVHASRSWLKAVQHNPRFRFTARLWQKFLLERSSYTSQDVLLVRHGMDVLMDAGRLGALLLSFPQSFHNNIETRSWLFRIITEFKMYPLIVEFRHNSWEAPEVLQMLRDRDVGIASIDQPIVGNGMPLRTLSTATFACFMLYGRNTEKWFDEQADRNARHDYLYSKEELQEFRQAVEKAIKAATAVYVVFGNHFRGQALCNAFELQHMLTGQNPAIPRDLVRAFPVLQNIRRRQNPRQLELW